MAEVGTFVLTSNSTRMQRGRLRGFDAGTPISWAHIKGTSPQPSCRAAAAGNSDVRSGVVVNQAAAMSSGWIVFSCAIRASNSVVAWMIAASLSSSVVVAPRIPRTAIPLYLLGAPRYRCDGGGPVVG